MSLIKTKAKIETAIWGYARKQSIYPCDIQPVSRGTEMPMSKARFHSTLKCSESFPKRNCELADKVSKQCSQASPKRPRLPLRTDKRASVGVERPCATLPMKARGLCTAESTSFPSFLLPNPLGVPGLKTLPFKGTQPNDTMSRTVSPKSP